MILIFLTCSLQDSCVRIALRYCAGLSNDHALEWASDDVKQAFWSRMCSVDESRLLNRVCKQASKVAPLVPGPSNILLKHPFSNNSPAREYIN